MEHNPVQPLTGQGRRTGGRYGSDLVSQIPRGQHDSAICLEFGCGNGQARPLLEELGYRWVGVDIAGGNVTVLCDGHHLSFADQSFDLIVTVAVFEHLYDPFRAARELYRVLRPGGLLVGTTAFLEQFHANSYFHMTHLGVQRVFSTAGFEVTHLWPTWHFAESLATFWIPNQLSVLHSLFASTLRVAAGNLMHVRAWGLRKYLSGRGLSQAEIQRRVETERLTWTGAIGFRAQKPVEAPNHSAAAQLGFDQVSATDGVRPQYRTVSSNYRSP